MTHYITRLDFSRWRCILEPESYLGAVDPLTSARIFFAVVFGNLGAESCGMGCSQIIPVKELSHFLKVKNWFSKLFILPGKSPDLSFQNHSLSPQIKVCCSPQLIVYCVLISTSREEEMIVLWKHQGIAFRVAGCHWRFTESFNPDKEAWCVYQWGAFCPVLTSWIGTLVTVWKYSWFPFEMRRMELFKEPALLQGEGCYAEMCTTHSEEP